MPVFILQGTYFIRCIKPNVQNIQAVFDDASVSAQLTSSSILPLCELNLFGYPFHADISEIFSTYKRSLNLPLSSTEFCRLILRANRIGSEEFKISKKKVFLRSEKQAKNIFGNDEETVRLNLELIMEHKSKIRAKWRVLYIAAVFVSQCMSKIILSFRFFPYPRKKQILKFLSVKTHLSTKVLKNKSLMGFCEVWTKSAFFN